MKTNKIWGWFWIALGVLYFFVPLYATLQFSLKAQKGQLSLLAYVRVFQDPQFSRTLTFSLAMAVLTIVVSLALIVPTAYWIRLRLPRLRPSPRRSCSARSSPRRAFMPRPCSPSRPPPSTPSPAVV